MKKTYFLILALAIISSMAFAEEVKQVPQDSTKVQAPKATPPSNIRVQRVPAQKVAMVSVKAADYAPNEGYPKGREGTMIAFKAMFEDGYKKLGEWMKAGNHPMGASIAIYEQDPDKTLPAKLTLKVGFPVADNAKENEQVKIETLAAQECAVLKYSGDYDRADSSWTQLRKWMEENHFVSNGAGMEVFIKGPKDTNNPQEYVTEIRQPVKREDSKLRQQMDRPKPNAKPDMKVSKDVKVGTAK